MLRIGWRCHKKRTGTSQRLDIIRISNNIVDIQRIFSMLRNDIFVILNSVIRFCNTDQRCVMNTDWISENRGSSFHHFIH